MPQHYPFSAVVGCAADDLDDMGLALVLTTISPEIGGVLVRGEKGTAKSTSVRALGALFPPLVELPIGATEDRVIGSIQLESALTEGRIQVEQGLLARAHGGLLYVDEVNLLHDHLVDLLLDAAAMGRVTVERDGISVEHDARFVLIGTMNPEEGELRPQLLDRFGLTVEVAAPRDPGLRAEVVRRRMAYDADPAAFSAGYAAAEAAFAERVAHARERVAKVLLGDATLLKIAEICAAFEVDGLRADIVTARTAVAHAAWAGRDEVTRADIRRAALLALPHRRRRNPFDAPGLDEDLLDQLLGDEELPPEPPEGGAPDETESSADEPGGDTDPAAPDSSESSESGPESPASGGAPEATVGSGTPYRPKLLKVSGLGAGQAGRRSRAIATSGRRVGARPGGDGSLHLVETLKAAAARGTRVLEPRDLRVAVREGREANLVLFCVDASGSMAARKRMTQVKTAILSLLLDAYRRRDKVGLVTFRGLSADVALPPTHSVDVAASRLEELPAGGRTPLAEGLLEAAKVLQRERLRDPRLRPLLVIVTDGRATGGADAVARSQQAAAYVAGLGVATVVVDSETGPLRLGLAARLAETLGAEHLPVAEVSAEALAATVTRKVA
ncbi:MAG TPA: VWA domain-containing protein [Nocardioides sp.]|nr:VWA domain-containing protein [Nocardioides sp.]